jgi:hypothetical protein
MRAGLHVPRFVLMLVLTPVSWGCSDSSSSDPVSACGDGECPEQSCDDFDPLRQPLFGDTHVHTFLSFDANIRGTRVGPADAYRYAQGEPISIQPYDEEGNPVRTIHLERPLDYAMVSDHAEFLGTVPQCTDPAQPAYNHPECDDFRAGGLPAFAAFGLLPSAPPESAVYPELCGEDASLCIEVGMDVWQDEIIAAAEAAHDASGSCGFTALIGYEWTANTGTNNLHRNVVFRNSIVPDQAVNYFDEPYVEGLWERLREDCIDLDDGCDALTIPHNSNLAGGKFFEPMGRDGAFDSEYAAERAFMEPLIEIYQHKGQSECKPGESISDELCGFEILPATNFSSTTVGQFTEPSARDFVRAAFGEGMKQEASLGHNPFKHGIIASTDTHIAAPGSVQERNYPGNTNIDGDFSGEPRPGLITIPYRSPGGLAGVWAEENSREAIFLAMRRQETFGTSGPEIVVRFFGGWSYPAMVCDDPDLAAIGYRDGVPMGGDLPAPPNSDAARPTFIVSAKQDPGTAEDPGMPLQRLQIVKGWIDDAGEYRVRVFEVEGNPDNGATVDLATCETQPGAGGFASLCTTWTDPDFNSSHRSYYYARVIENPKCRWSQHACIAAGVDCADPETVTEGFEECCDLSDEECSTAQIECTSNSIPEGFESCCRPRVPKTIQERAWTSPIWYSPS